LPLWEKIVIHKTPGREKILMPQFRKDPIVNRWVIISAERAMRPSDFTEVVGEESEEVEEAKANCPFDEGNEGATPPEVMAYRPKGSKPDTPGWTIRVVPNKFPAVSREGQPTRTSHGMYDQIDGVGAHEVIIETPDHDLKFTDFPSEQLQSVLRAYGERMTQLKKDARLDYILIVRNHRKQGGASLKHPHSQLIALPFVPHSVMEELEGSKQYFDNKKRCIFCDIVQQEIEERVRLVDENEDFLAICPYAPRFPFEVWILPKKHRTQFEETTRQGTKTISEILQRTLKRLDVALNNPPYNLWIHTSPISLTNPPYYHWHIEITPQIALVAGFERGSDCYINSVPPEDAAQTLRGVKLAF
jgi:UDPglucose--hexose-1-phosphate uridylyltransferase